MSPTVKFTVNVDEKLALNKYHVDEGFAHIELSDAITDAEFRLLMLACPAGLYRLDDQGNRRFDYAGCLECGTCRILCGQSGLARWEYPVGSMGVEYRWG
jgi:ferredoxin-like protein FixX